ncbi:MAG: DsrE family protein [Gammaproteobacteria bacterium]
MRSMLIKIFGLTALFAGLGVLPAAGAAQPGADGQHRVVIQVNSGDAATQNLALNNAVNLQKAYGQDHVAIEVVAYGPGLSLLTRQSPQAERVQSLAMQDIAFSACGNTMKAVAKKTGKTPQLTEGVKVVPAGVGRIIELQEQGYAYVKP